MFGHGVESFTFFSPECPSWISFDLIPVFLWNKLGGQNNGRTLVIHVSVCSSGSYAAMPDRYANRPLHHWQ